MQTPQPQFLFLQSSSRPWYFSFFLSCAPSSLCLYGTVNSNIATCLVEVDHSTMSGLCAVTAISCGNVALTCMFACICQSDADNRIPLASVLPVTDTPLRTKLTNVKPFCTSRFLFLALSSPSASTASTLSWRHVYLPSARAVLHDDSMCYFHNFVRDRSVRICQVQL